VNKPAWTPSKEKSANAKPAPTKKTPPKPAAKKKKEKKR
jgi:hypothetical protein